MEVKKFKNYSEDDFIYSFDGVPHTFKKGMEIFLEDYKAEHFAKHLVDREMNRMNVLTNNMSVRAELLTKCFPTDEVAPTISEAIDTNEKKKVKVTKKVETEFEDLEDK